MSAKKRSSGNELWSVPGLFQSKVVVVIATGPSLTPYQVDLCRDAGLSAIAVNNGYEYAPWADVLYAADQCWWRYYWGRGKLGGSGAGEFDGLKVTTESPYDPSVLQILSSGVSGFDPRPDRIRTGKNSAYQAVHIAAHGGASGIILIGCDCCRPENGPSHCFGEHNDEIRRDSPYESFAENWQAIAGPLRDMGIPVFNCSPGSAIECFEKHDLKDVLAQRL